MKINAVFSDFGNEFYRTEKGWKKDSKDNKKKDHHRIGSRIISERLSKYKLLICTVSGYNYRDGNYNPDPELAHFLNF